MLSVPCPSRAVRGASQPRSARRAAFSSTGKRPPPCSPVLLGVGGAVACRILSPAREETVLHARSVQTIKSDQRDPQGPGSRCLSPGYRAAASDAPPAASLWRSARCRGHREERPLLPEALRIRPAAAGSFPVECEAGIGEGRARPGSRRGSSASWSWRVRRAQRRGGRSALEGEIFTNAEGEAFENGGWACDPSHLHCSVLCE